MNKQLIKAQTPTNQKTQRITELLEQLENNRTAFHLSKIFTENTLKQYTDEEQKNIKKLYKLRKDLNKNEEKMNLSEVLEEKKKIDELNNRNFSLRKKIIVTECEQHEAEQENEKTAEKIKKEILELI